MSGRRASLPGAAELFRSTNASRQNADRATRSEPSAENGESASAAEQVKPVGSDGAETAGKPSKTGTETARRGSGRQRHSSKITVYLSDEELLALEQARLSLRAEHQLAVDRGRIVREAVAVLLEDYESGGAGSLLVRRLERETDAS